MSDRHYYLRATIDFTVWDRHLVMQLRGHRGDPFSDEQLGRLLNDSVKRGDTEIDGVKLIEDHGDSEEGASY